MLVRLEEANGDRVQELEIDPADIPRVSNSAPEGIVWEGRTFFCRFKDDDVWVYREGLMFSVPETNAAEPATPATPAKPAKPKK